MSGSPIIQNGKLVGAVTHVFVNEIKTRYLFNTKKCGIGTRVSFSIIRISMKKIAMEKRKMQLTMDDFRVRLLVMRRCVGYVTKTHKVRRISIR